MKITILSNRDLASCVALNHLLPQLCAHSVRVFLSSRVGKPAANNATPEALDSLKFFEQGLFNNLVFPSVDEAPLPTSPALLTFKGLACFLSAEIEELNEINGADYARFAASEPDLVLSIRYGVILRDAAIAVPAQGVLNLHSGRLPDYKGVMATFRALMNGDSELNMTLHTIDDSGIDTGKIVGYSTLRTVPEKSYLWHVLNLYEGGCQLMADAVAKMTTGASLGGIDQASLVEQGSYYTFPTQVELAEFGEAGLRLVDSAELVDIAGKFTHGK